MHSRPSGRTLYDDRGQLYGAARKVSQVVTITPEARTGMSQVATISPEARTGMSQAATSNLQDLENRSGWQLVRAFLEKTSRWTYSKTFFPTSCPWPGLAPLYQTQSLSQDRETLCESVDIFSIATKRKRKKGEEKKKSSFLPTCWS